MKIEGTDFKLSNTAGKEIDTMHLEINGLCVSFTHWKDFSQEGAPFLSLKKDGQSVANIQGKSAVAVIAALDDYGVR